MNFREETLLCVVSTKQVSRSAPFWVCLVAAQEEKARVVTQSLSSLKLFPFKSEMSSEAGEMSSEPSLWNRCQIQEGSLKG